jgi:hypothetical protein
VWLVELVAELAGYCRLWRVRCDLCYSYRGMNSSFFLYGIFVMLCIVCTYSLEMGKVIVSALIGADGGHYRASE